MEAQNIPLRSPGGGRRGSYRVLAPRPWSPKRFETIRCRFQSADVKYQQRKHTEAGISASNSDIGDDSARISRTSFAVERGKPGTRKFNDTGTSQDTLHGSSAITANNCTNCVNRRQDEECVTFDRKPLPCNGGPGTCDGLASTSGLKPSPNSGQALPRPTPRKPNKFGATSVNNRSMPSGEKSRKSTGAETSRPRSRSLLIERPSAIYNFLSFQKDTTGTESGGLSASCEKISMETPEGSEKRPISSVKEQPQSGQQSTRSTAEDVAHNKFLTRARKDLGRSASVSEAELRDYSKKVNEPSKAQVASRNLKNMLSQKWISDREDLACKINLSEPTVMPQLTTGENSIDDNGASANLLPNLESKEALNCAALRLRRVTQGMEKDEIEPQLIKETLQYAISVLEMRFLGDKRVEERHGDVHLSLQGDNVAPEIKRWLMQTFSTTGTDGRGKRPSEKRTLRSVVHVMQAGMFVERMFRKSTAAATLSISPEIQTQLKNIGKYSFDVFELERVSCGNALKFVTYEVLNKYDFLAKFKISSKTLFSYCDRLQAGYRKHSNRYHNSIHAADVTQCMFYFLNESGFLHWLSDLEVFAILFASAVHDLEHTGTTNDFHTQTRSSLALLYNDRSVLENHHVSAAFNILWNEADCDILSSLSKDDYRQFRSLVVEMVLATDMSLHFGQIQNIKSTLVHPESLERSKVMSMMMHCADISHPTRPWELHHRWTARLIEEFFYQGDRERALELPISPLCDRHSTMIAQSQIGFLDYVVIPTFEVLGDVFWEVTTSVNGDAAGVEDCSSPSSAKRERSSSVGSDDSASRRFSDGCPVDEKFLRAASVKGRIKEFKITCNNNTKQNRQRWVDKDEIEREAKDNLQRQNQTAHENHVKDAPST